MRPPSAFGDHDAAAPVPASQSFPSARRRRLQPQLLALKHGQ